MTGVKIEPMVNPQHETGASGYYSVIYTLASGPYKTIEDLKGRTWPWSIRTPPPATRRRASS